MILKRIINFRNIRKLLLKKKIPYELFTEYKTLKNTDYKYWFAYIPELHLSFRSSKVTDIIDRVWYGRKYKEVLNG